MAGGREERARLRQLEPRRASRAAAYIRRLSGDEHAVELRDLFDEFSEIGGDLLAAALALRALVGFLVALLLVAVIVGVLSDDPTLRAVLVERAAGMVPGLDEPVRAMLRELSSGRATYSALALVGLAWTVGGIYGTLDDALRRVFPGGRGRGIVERRARGLLAVVLVVGAVGFALALSATWSAVEGHLLGGADWLAWRVLNPLLSAALASALVLALFRFVPTAPPSAREAGLPAIVAGTVVSALTAAYALIAPRLVGALSVFGAVAAVIGTLLWLTWVFRVVLMTGLWACRRRDAAPRTVEGGDRAP